MKRRKSGSNTSAIRSCSICVILASEEITAGASFFLYFLSLFFSQDVVTTDVTAETTTVAVDAKEKGLQLQSLIFLFSL